MIALQNSDGIAVIHADTMEVLAHISRPDIVAFEFSKDGNHVLTSEKAVEGDPLLKVWDSSTGERQAALNWLNSAVNALEHIKWSAGG